MYNYKKYTQQFKVKGKEVVNKIEELIHEGNVRRIIVKDSHGKKYMEIPVIAGVIGALISPTLAGIGALTGLAANFTIEIERVDDDNYKEVDYIELKNNEQYD